MTVDVITRPKINAVSRAYSRTNTGRPRLRSSLPHAAQHRRPWPLAGRPCMRQHSQEAVALWNVTACPDYKQSLPRPRRPSGAEEFPLTLEQNTPSLRFGFCQLADWKTQCNPPRVRFSPVSLACAWTCPSRRLRHGVAGKLLLTDYKLTFVSAVLSESVLP